MLGSPLFVRTRIESRPNGVKALPEITNFGGSDHLIGSCALAVLFRGRLVEQRFEPCLIEPHEGVGHPGRRHVPQQSLGHAQGHG
jgi:hypothetical protein